MNKLDQLNAELAHDDTCPACLGELDTGWECTECGFDAFPIVLENPGPELTAEERAAMDAMPPASELMQHWGKGETWQDGKWEKKN